MVERLEARATHPTFVAMLDEYLDAMGIDQADRVIDLGCGTGVGTLTILRRPGFQGSVLGLDLSPRLVEVARQHAQADGTADRAEFRAGDTTSLDVGDASFDAAIAQTLLSHVPDPARGQAYDAALIQAIVASPRVTRDRCRGGRLPRHQHLLRLHRLPADNAAPSQGIRRVISRDVAVRRRRVPPAAPRWRRTSLGRP